MGEQMSEQESLRDALTHAAWPDGQRDGFPTRRVAEFLADAALAWFAEHRGPRVVSTVEELDALPVGSVVLDGARYLWLKCGATEWQYGGAYDRPVPSDYLVNGKPGVFGEVGGTRGYGPFTVLFTPSTESEDR